MVIARKGLGNRSRRNRWDWQREREVSAWGKAATRARGLRPRTSQYTPRSGRYAKKKRDLYILWVGKRKRKWGLRGRGHREIGKAKTIDPRNKGRLAFSGKSSSKRRKDRSDAQPSVGGRSCERKNTQQKTRTCLSAALPTQGPHSTRLDKERKRKGHFPTLRTQTKKAAK